MVLVLGGAFCKCRRALGVLLTQRGLLVAFALERINSVIKLLTAFHAPSGGLAAG
jgi:hypothetical protein